jgi:hypothetical protein
MDLDLENGGGGNNDAAVALLRSPDLADPYSHFNTCNTNF